MTKLISCDMHDHFEIVCMRKSQVTVTTKNGETISGQASNICINADKKEQLLVTQNDNVTAVDLTDIAKLEAHGNLVPQHNFVVMINLSSG
ncbi:MAG: hypothetical protein CMK64_11535 [Pseudoalteromonas sp.]|nr:hypothetical protein [Pseudoalteromonas sp.]|tara:strand:+ start:759 stop:1031 length:273 start_codon:yes stop_codon:yes gene_type:complete